jgi:DNA-binding FrmR family transcriptional regulator
MAHTTRDKDGLLLRLRRVKGQVAGLERALSEDAPCAAVLQQLAAVRGAVNGLMAEVLEGHIKEHLADDDRSVAQRQRDLDALLRVLRSYLK